MRAIKRVLTACCVLAGLLMTGNASAYSFDIWAGEPALAPYPAPYASVDISFGTMDSTQIARVTFTGLNFSTAQYPSGQYLLDDVGLNLVDPTHVTLYTTTSTTDPNRIVITDSTWTQSGTAYALSSHLPQQYDGFGDMNFALQNAPTGFAGAVKSVSFTLLNGTGTDWSSLSNLLVNNNNNGPIGDSWAAAHIVVWDGDTQNNNGAITTGFAATVPEPCTLFLLGGGALVGLAGFRKKRSKA